jgi:hypothetical protein
MKLYWPLPAIYYISISIALSTELDITGSIKVFDLRTRPKPKEDEPKSE